MPPSWPQGSDDRCPSSPSFRGKPSCDTRLIRHAYGEGERYVPLVLRAQALWDELAKQTEERIFERTGIINLGPARSDFLASVERSAKTFNLDVEKLDAAGIMSRWPEITVPDDYVGLFEAHSGVLHCETAIKTWIALAAKAGCAQLFNCPVEAIKHDADGVTVTTLDGEYTASRLLISAGTWVTRLLPDLPVQPVRKVFSWFQSDGRYSTQNKFPAFTGELPNGDQFYGFPSDKDALKIGKHNGGQIISSPEERKPWL